MNFPDQLAAPSMHEHDTSSDAEMLSEEAMLFCPNCDQHLTSRHCKLLCERCGYFMSCADYY